MLTGKVLPLRHPGEGSQNGQRKNPRDGYRRSLRGDSTRMSSQSYQDSLTTTSPLFQTSPTLRAIVATSAQRSARAFWNSV
jgi:hypothetical protein